jgi:small subunit ribosomal protein S6e
MEMMEFYPYLNANPRSQNEYAQIMHKRVAEEKAKQAEMRKRRASSMRK